MGSINPNPPTQPDPVLVGKQSFHAWGMAPFNLDQLSVVAGNGINMQFIGTNYAGVESTLNPVTRIKRRCQRAAAGAAADAACYVAANNTGINSALVFPGQNFDGGFRLIMLGGLDSAVSTLATTAFIFGAVSGLSGGVTIPSSGAGPITTASFAWIGAYTNNNGVISVGYKNVGGAIVDLATNIPLPWLPYQVWKFDITFSPVGPRTYYAYSYLNASGTAFLPAASGSTTAFAPGRFGLGPQFNLRKTTAADVCEIWTCGAQALGYTLGLLSL